MKTQIIIGIAILIAIILIFNWKRIFGTSTKTTIGQRSIQSAKALQVVFNEIQRTGIEKRYILNAPSPFNPKDIVKISGFAEQGREKRHCEFQGEVLKNGGGEMFVETIPRGNGKQISYYWVQIKPIDDKNKCVNTNEFINFSGKIKGTITKV